MDASKLQVHSGLAIGDNFRVVNWLVVNCDVYLNLSGNFLQVADFTLLGF